MKILLLRVPLADCVLRGGGTEVALVHGPGPADTGEEGEEMRAGWYSHSPRGGGPALGIANDYDYDYDFVLNC